MALRQARKNISQVENPKKTLRRVLKYRKNGRHHVNKRGDGTRSEKELTGCYRALKSKLKTSALIYVQKEAIGGF